jgi:hypothetical protein
MAASFQQCKFLTYDIGINEMVRRATTLTSRIRRIIDMKIRSIGIDLGKTTFHLVALGDRGKILLKKKLSRKGLLAWTTNLPASLIGPEACGCPSLPRSPSCSRDT